MSAIARASFLVALASLVGCADPGVTTPTAPSIPLGTPQTLTVAADPTTIPYAGGPVHVTAVVTVEPGARMPASMSVQAPHAHGPSLVPLRVDGHLDTYVVVTISGDLVVKAGELERRIAIAQEQPPAVPEQPPTCNGAPWPCPTPTPQPDPAPPSLPVDTIKIDLPAPSPTAPATTLRANQDLNFTATVSAVLGDPVPVPPSPGVTYRWAIKDGSQVYTDPDQSTQPMATGGSVITKVIKFRNAGSTSVGIEVVLADGTNRRAYKRVDFTVLP